MTEGPAVGTGIMWVFTLGEPPIDLMDGFTRLTASGAVDWVIWPIMQHRDQYFADMDIISVGLIP